MTSAFFGRQVVFEDFQSNQLRRLLCTWLVVLCATSARRNAGKTSELKLAERSEVAWAGGSGAQVAGCFGRIFGELGMFNEPKESGTIEKKV